jgi:hypothetical protein
MYAVELGGGNGGTGLDKFKCDAVNKGAYMIYRFQLTSNAVMSLCAGEAGKGYSNMSGGGAGSFLKITMDGKDYYFVAGGAAGGNKITFRSGGGGGIGAGGTFRDYNLGGSVGDYKAVSTCITPGLVKISPDSNDYSCAGGGGGGKGVTDSEHDSNGAVANTVKINMLMEDGTAIFDQTKQFGGNAVAQACSGGIPMSSHGSNITATKEQCNSCAKLYAAE